MRTQVILKLFVPHEYEQLVEHKLRGLISYKFESTLDLEPGLYSKIIYMNSASWWLDLLNGSTQEKLSERLSNTCSKDGIIGKTPDINLEEIEEMWLHMQEDGLAH